MTQEEFIDYLTSLTMEGETPLLVLQKPVKKDGELQYHRDGAIKCTWPAMLPGAKIRKGSAIYGNTGSFITERLSSRVSASAQNCEFCICMVLDDVGTKSKTPPLKPTWRMETSPGNEQWGYVFSEQPSKAVFSAAIIAIAEAGYTDKGAINPVRNFRIPGSVNIKPYRAAFESRVVEFNRDVEYTIEEICSALNVTPKAASTAQHRSVDLEDDGKDEVAAWLKSQGMVLERPNGTGWMGVLCPNAEEHTDGNPMGRYNPLHRAYCCLHAHCGDWDSERYLKWVAEQGGPDVGYGTRDDVLTAKMASVMDKLEAVREEQGSQFSKEADADAAIKAAEKKAQLREVAAAQKSDWYRRFAYVEQENAYFDMDECRVIIRPAFDSLFRHIPCNSIFGKGPKVTPSVCYDENRHSNGGRVIINVTYAPGEGNLVAQNGLLYGNKWRNARPEFDQGVTDSEVWRWLQHAEQMIPKAEEREHIFNVLAYKVQHPERKINHALLICGKPGAGKDTLLAPFFYAVGGPNHNNVSVSDSKTMESDFNYDLENEVIVINELRPEEFKDRRALENTLKPIIAAPPEFLMINRKHSHPYPALNRALVIAFSNFRDAIALPSDDRRWFVTWAEGEKKDCRPIWDWYKQGGFSAIAGWLATRDVSTFDPGAPPPITEAKKILITQSRSSAEEFLVHYIEAGMGDFARGVIGAPFYKILDRIQGVAPERVKLTQSALMHALDEAGWVDRGLVYSTEFPTKKRLWCSPNLMGYTKSDLRRMIEEAAPAEQEAKAVIAAALEKSKS